MENSKALISNKTLNIGGIFTPLQWGQFAIEKFAIYQKWLNGATVFDPTMGEGHLLEALISYAILHGKKISELPTNNLFGNEINTNYFHTALKKFQSMYGLNMQANFFNEDLLVLSKKKYDIVFGNPPWQNFVDLPTSYKEQIKSYFFQYDLVGNSQDLLLGGSRIDISALMIQIAMKDFLVKNGEAIFFMPLSLLLNDGANKNFRTYCINSINYAIESVFDFNDEDVFGVATRYSLTHFIRDKKAFFPIPFFRMCNKKWKKYIAEPIFSKTDPLSVFSKNEPNSFKKIQPIVIKKESSPRQGVNPCGACEFFFFNQWKELDEHLVKVSNQQKKNIILPRQFIFPLITKENFQSEKTTPLKWVLLPYHKNGKPLQKSQIESFPLLNQYLNDNISILQNRKGIMLNAILKRGYWWALLGVGYYNFFPFKVVWESYGKKTFCPKIFAGYWQANQSLQAFIPTKNLKEAKKIAAKLSDKKIENYLLSLKMEGTMNWAQPGKIKKLIRYQ